MDSYLNLHLAIEQMRVIASQQGENGPRVSLNSSTARTKQHHTNTKTCVP